MDMQTVLIILATFTALAILNALRPYLRYLRVSQYPWHKHLTYWLEVRWFKFTSSIKPYRRWRQRQVDKRYIRQMSQTAVTPVTFHTPAVDTYEPLNLDALPRDSREYGVHPSEVLMHDYVYAEPAHGAMLN